MIRFWQVGELIVVTQKRTRLNATFELAKVQEVETQAHPQALVITCAFFGQPLTLKRKQQLKHNWSKLPKPTNGLILDLSNEPLMLKSPYIQPYLQLVQEEFPGTNICWVSQNAKSFQQDHPDFKHLYVQGFRASVAQFPQPQPPKSQFSPKRFLMLGGYPRPSKLRIFLAAQVRGWLNPTSAFAWSLSDLRPHTKLFTITERWFKLQSRTLEWKQLTAQSPTLLDALDPGQKGPTINDHPWLYQQGELNLVLETEMFNGQRVQRYTEKILKAIHHSQPFLVFGNPLTLQLLQQDGFQTFAPWLNEDYDTILDPEERVQALLIEVERLRSLSDESWQDLLGKCRQICQANYETLQTAEFATKAISQMLR